MTNIFKEAEKKIYGGPYRYKYKKGDRVEVFGESGTVTRVGRRLGSRGIVWVMTDEGEIPVTEACIEEE